MSLNGLKCHSKLEKILPSFLLTPGSPAISSKLCFSFGATKTFSWISEKNILKTDHDEPIWFNKAKSQFYSIKWWGDVGQSPSLPLVFQEKKYAQQII